MQETPEGLVLSPTDLTKYLACAHLTSLDLQVARHEITAPMIEDEALDLIFRLGLEHEASYLETLKAEHPGGVVEISEDLPTDERVERTIDAMRAGAEVIFQASFLHEGSRGHADFLLRVDRPSDLGPWSYDVADTKLARRMKVAALLQMADYGRHLARIQSAPPRWLYVVTGDKEVRPFRYADAAAYARRATARLRKAVEDPQPTKAEPNAHCAQCRWAPRCESEWRQADHLSLVPFMSRDHRELLEAAGVTTVAALAAADPGTLPAEIGEAPRVRLQSQAALQMEERITGKPRYELLEAREGLGLLRLPEPNPGDVYLDFEGDPYAAGGEGREYLAGLWTRGGEFVSWWAHDADQERTMTEALLADLNRRLDENPGMHVYHYAPYERSVLARLTQRYGVAEIAFDRLLRGEVLVDLYAVVRQGLRISKESYSIKKLEAFYWGKVRQVVSVDEGVADALSSVVQYEKWLLHKNDQGILDGIEAYNRDDCESTWALHEWLEKLRAEVETRGGSAYARPEPATVPDLVLTDDERIEVDLAAELHEAEERVLAGLVGWHRRELRPRYWDFFRVKDLSDDELIRDRTALGGLGQPVAIGTVKRSTIWRIPFPAQDCKLDGKVTNVDTHKPVWTVENLDPVAGHIDLRISTARGAPVARGLGIDPPLMSQAQQGSIRRMARDVLAGVRSPLLDRVVPPGLDRRDGESAGDVVLRVGRDLAGTVLAVQGPPGAGKTHTGARLIRQLLDAGKTVGVTAQSHEVIGNLLRAIDRPAIQKCTDAQHCGHDAVVATDDNAAIVDALAAGAHNLVGGTSWLWSREDLERTVDVLVIDEAGQFSLADALAVSRAAAGLVLLGDPQQLASPTQVVHPEGVGVSALEHLLAGESTMPPSRGVFLDATWRMHPSITEVVSAVSYDGRLASVAGLGNQALFATGLPEHGIQWEPVVHLGHASASTEEALVVADLVRRALAGRWRDATGVERRMTAADVLVVAPYNAQVARLRQHLPSDVAVGTVDKFQGQEAPVVVYSMTSSSAEDAPRGVSFLYDLHRLNVAISRARCLVLVVGSPLLLDAPTTTPVDLRRVNGLLTVVDASQTSA